MSARLWVELGAFRAARALVSALGPERARRVAGRLAERRFEGGDRHVAWALANLRVAFPQLPEGERRAIARQSFVHLAWNAVDWVCSWGWSAAEFEAHVDIEGLDLLRAAREKGHGVLMLTAHLGNFELGASALAARGFPTAIVGRAMGNARIWAHVARQRARFGNELIDRDMAAPRMLRVLRRGGLVGVLNDQYVRRAHGIFVPFLGARCSTSPGVATLAVRSGAPVLPVSMLRDAPDHHTHRFLPPLEIPASGDRARDIAEATARGNAALEALIREHPEQWLWSHRRFRHSPDVPSGIYD